jgi:hypothetical protein
MKKMIAVLVDEVRSETRRANISHTETVQKEVKELKESCRDFS